MIDTLRPKLIIFEGQDRVGKTTLIKSLRKMIKNPKVIGLASSSPPSDVTDDWSYTHYYKLMGMTELLLQTGWTVIMDRFHIGETVYGPIYRKSKTDYIWDYESEIFGDNPNIWLITLVADPEDLVARDDGESNEASIAEYKKTKDAFEESHHRSSIQNKLLINVSKQGFAEPKQLLELIYA